MNDVGRQFEPSYDFHADSDRTENVHQHTTTQKDPRQPLLSATLLRSLIIALALALFIRFFIAAPYMVSGASMDPTFEPWNYLIIDRVSYMVQEPERGDIVVFRFPEDPSRSFIKRIIGLPGETVVLNGQSVVVRNDENPDGFELEEPYIAPENMRESRMTVELGDDEYFVLGDNRRESADSRVWGTLPRDLIVGKVFVRLFPFSSVDIWPGEARYGDTQ